MSDFVIVTVKLKKNPDHDPRNKVTGPCPVSPDNLQCTDVTGEHHSILHNRDGMTLEDVRLDFEGEGYHVTRIEAVE